MLSHQPYVLMCSLEYERRRHREKRMMESQPGYNPHHIPLLFYPSFRAESQLRETTVNQLVRAREKLLLFTCESSICPVFPEMLRVSSLAFHFSESKVHQVLVKSLVRGFKRVFSFNLAVSWTEFLFFCFHILALYFYVLNFSRLFCFIIQ